MPFSIELHEIELLPWHQPLPVWKQEGEDRCGFVAKSRAKSIRCSGLQTTEKAKDSVVLRGCSLFVRRDVQPEGRRPQCASHP